MNRLDRLRFIRRIVIFAELMQNDLRSIMHGNFVIGAFVVIRLDVFEGRDEVEIVNRIEMAFDVFQSFWSTLHGY